MNVISSILVLVGAAVALLAGIGLLKFTSPYARFHAAGKATPVAFLLIAAAVALETGWVGAAKVGVAAAALVLTLPVSVHLLFRAVHRTSPERHLQTDQLAPVVFNEQRSARTPLGQGNPSTPQEEPTNDN